ncbi:MAG: hypothetical protein HXX17_08130 [Geobacteraceae bacterium]|nr:hypothetical protein [Geobacteraceae bacterium]
MMKNWILRWLGIATEPNHSTPNVISRDGDSLIYGLKHRNMFEVIDAVNGKVVVFNRRFDNPSGPDKNDMEVYLVPNGADLMETITVALVSAKLK